jgi:hypothetical protein
VASLTQDYDVAAGAADVDRSVPVADRLLGRYGPGSVASLSFDNGFTRTEDRELLSLYVPVVVMPQRGKKNAAETARNKLMTASGRSSSVSDTPKNLPSAAGAGKKIKSGKPAHKKPTTT